MEGTEGTEKREEADNWDGMKLSFLPPDEVNGKLMPRQRCESRVIATSRKKKKIIAIVKKQC